MSTGDSSRRSMFRGALSALGGLAAGMLLAPRTAEAQQRLTLADLQAQLNALAQRNADLEADLAELALQVNSAPVMWSGYSSTQGNIGSAGSSIRYPLDRTEFDTAQQYLSVDPSGIVRVLRAGFYRINFWTISYAPISGSGSGYAHARVILNGQTIHYGYEHVSSNTWTDNTLDVTYAFEVNDQFFVDVTIPVSGGYAFHAGSPIGRHSRMQIAYVGPLPNA